MTKIDKDHLPGEFLSTEVFKCQFCGKKNIDDSYGFEDPETKQEIIVCEDCYADILKEEQKCQIQN